MAMELAENVILPRPDTLVLRNKDAVLNWKSTFPLPKRIEAIRNIRTLKISEEAWEEMLDFSESRVEYLWLTSVSVPWNQIERFCQAFIAAISFEGQITVREIESFDLKFTESDERPALTDFARTGRGFATLNQLRGLTSMLRTLKVYVTVDAGPLQLTFWDHFLSTPGLETSIEKLVILTNSRNIFAVPNAQTVGTCLIRYISRYRALRELSLHGLWTQVQTVLVSQVPRGQLSLLSISPLPTDDSFQLHRDVMKHMHREARGQTLGFYGVNGIPAAVKPFAAVPASVLVIDLTTVRKLNGNAIIAQLAQAPGPFACENLYFRRKGSKEPLEDLADRPLRESWSLILDKVESIVFECRFDFETSSQKVWDATFCSIMTAIADHEGPCRLKRLRFEDCVMDEEATGHNEMMDICRRALDKLQNAYDIHIPLTNKFKDRYMFGLADCVLHRQWSPQMHRWCCKDLIRRPFVIILFALSKYPLSRTMPRDLVTCFLQHCFKVFMNFDEQGQPHLPDAEIRRRLFLPLMG